MVKTFLKFEMVIIQNLCYLRISLCYDHMACYESKRSGSIMRFVKSWTSLLEQFQILDPPI